MRRLFRLAGLTLALTSAVTAQAQLRGTSSDQPSPIIHIKPSDVTTPSGSKPGEIRRLIQPFADWTLICDENLKLRTRICNVAQTMVDEAGHLVFSWSLAATREGAPVFILRAPIAAKPGNHVALVDFGTGTAKSPTRSSVVLATCDVALCIGFLPTTRDIRQRIAAGGNVRIEIPDEPGGPIVLHAPLDGLGLAIQSIK